MGRWMGTGRRARSGSLTHGDGNAQGAGRREQLPYDPLELHTHVPAYTPRSSPANEHAQAPAQGGDEHLRVRGGRGVDEEHRAAAKPLLRVHLGEHLAHARLLAWERLHDEVREHLLMLFELQLLQLPDRS